MNFQKLGIAALIGGVIYFFLGWLVYGIILKDQMGGATCAELPEGQMKMGYMVLSCLAWGALIAYVAYNWASISTPKGGAMVGLILALFVSLTVGAGNASMYTFGNLESTLMDMVANGFCSAITGAAIGWFLGRN